MTQIAFITTTNHNVGDDFVREGVSFLLGETLAGERMQFESVHKHSPITVRHGFEWCRNIRYSRWLDRGLPLCLTPDRVLKADLIVQAGAPVYWCHETSHCGDADWIKPLLMRRYSRMKNKVPFLNIGAGTCQQYGSDGSEFLACAKDSAYLRDLHAMCAVTTVRDQLARKVLNLLDLDAPVIACPSIFARDMLEIEPKEGEYVVLNYMQGGGHFDFGQEIDGARWDRTFRAFYNDISKKETCIFACHDENEVRWAKEIDPKAAIFRSPDYRDYLYFYARAKYAIANRVHCAFVVASFGRPVFAIGTDSRVRMLSEIGAREAFVNDVDEARLMEETEFMQSGADGFADRFAAIKDVSLGAYRSALAPISMPAKAEHQTQELLSGLPSKA